jgi:two-component system response regulator DegU
MKILIADDNSAVRRMIGNILAHVTEEIYECSDGSEVMELYSRYKPDWVLMDIKMKKVNGIKATADLILKYPEAKVIIITNYPTGDLKEDAAKAGAVEFIDKDNLSFLESIFKKYS